VDFETKEAKQRAVVPDLTQRRKSIQEISVLVTPKERKQKTQNLATR
jgi:hypothetical protein